MYGYEVKPPMFRFVFPILIIIASGWIAIHPGWGGVGGIVMGIGILMSIMFVVVAVLRESRELLKEWTNKVEAETQQLVEISKLSEEDKNFVRRDYRIGLAKRHQYNERKKYHGNSAE